MIQSHAFRPSIYTVEECIEIRKNIEKNVNSLLRDMPSQTATKTAVVGMVEYGKIKDSVKKFVEMSIDSNKHLFGFDLFQLTDYELLHYNRYDLGAEYGWHTDGTFGDCKDFKLTCLLNLSTDEYEGGELELFGLGQSHETTITEFKKPGSLFVFPSWVSHRVTPITKGKRYSLTLFLTGPNLK